MKHASHRLSALSLLLLAAAPLAAEKVPAPWRAWLDEVRPIMTRAEQKAFDLFRTEEDRVRFRDAFWRVRDPDPASAVNEFQLEYGRRLATVRAKFGGPRSDRGRIYLLLGKPAAIGRFSGEQELVECELWSYSGLAARGLPPFLNFLFYKPGDAGEFKQFYPGMQGAADLVSPAAQGSLSTPLAAYQLVRAVSAELADAALSLIPGESDPYDRVASSTSSTVMARVQDLPEKDVPSAYLRDFSAAGGTVRVSDSSRRIMGWGDIAASGGGDSWFVSVAMLPDQVAWRQKSEESYLADIAVYLAIEDLNGRVVYSAERPTRLDVTAQRRREIEEKKVLFREFCPVVPGRYRVQATFINKGNGDFFTVARELAVGPGRPWLCAGFRLLTATGRRLPFAAGGLVVLSDPRFLYSRRDSLCGLVACASAPQAMLIDAAGREAAPLPLQPAGPGLYSFRAPLSEMAHGTYSLALREEGREVERRAVHVMPDHIAVQRPFSYERTDAESAPFAHLEILAEQYLNLGRPAESRALLQGVPAPQRTPAMLSLLAQACYNDRDYPRVLELLEGREGGRTYAELTLLANSAIEVKDYEKAARYLEQLRHYGDSSALNHLLAAAWTALGDGGKARQYHERALKLEESKSE